MRLWDGRPAYPGRGCQAGTPRRRPLSCFRPVFVVREEAAPRSARPLPIGPRRHVPAISWGQLGPRAAGGVWAAAGRARPRPAAGRVGVLSQPLYSTVLRGS